MTYAPGGAKAFKITKSNYNFLGVQYSLCSKFQIVMLGKSKLKSLLCLIFTNKIFPTCNNNYMAM